MGSKSGRKERHRARNELYQAIAGYETGPLARFREAFNPYLSGMMGGGVSQTMAGGQEALQSLFGLVPGLFDPNQKLEYGINAPGILDSLIARSQEAIQGRTRAAGQEMADLIPTRGGAAQRSLMDLYRGGAGEAANIETGLRTQAAERDLTDRLSMLMGISGGSQGIAGGMRQGVGSVLDALGHETSIYDRISALRGGIANQYFQRAQQKEQSRMQGLGMLGQGAGQIGIPLLGGLLSLIPGVGPVLGGLLGGMGGLLGGGGGGLFSSLFSGGQTGGAKNAIYLQGKGV